MFLANLVGSDGLIVLVIALVVIFGGSQLPKIARNVGTAGKEFRRAQQEAEDEARAADAAKATAPAAVPPAPVPTSPPAGAVPAAPAAPADNVTISRADLEALIDQRLGKGNVEPGGTGDGQPG